MDITLYYGEPNGPSLTVLAALYEKEIDAKLVAIDLTAGERHQHAALASVETAMSIEGEGPVVVVDGEPLADSVFIGCFFDEVGEQSALLPGDHYQRWEVKAWCRYIVERVAPAAAYLGTQAYLAEKLGTLSDEQFVALIAPISCEDLSERWQAARNNDFSDDKLEDSKNKIGQAVVTIEQKLAEAGDAQWLMGDFSLADLETYAWLAGMRHLLPNAFAGSPLTSAWMDRVKQRGSVQKALAKSTVAAPETVWAPGPEINRWG